MVDYGELSAWLRTHLKDAPDDLGVFTLRESFDPTPGEGATWITCGEVVVKSDSFTYKPDGTTPVTWRPVVKRCAGCLNT